MKVLVTGSAGHLGEALARALPAAGWTVRGVDLKDSPLTDRVGSIADPEFAADAVRGVDAVIHAATLHKPHVATHARRDFVDTNIGGTLNLLEAAVASAVRAFVFTSTTSAFGRSLNPPPGEAAAWVTEATPSRPKNIYGVTKCAAEDLCELFHLREGLACLVLRTSRFFPEEDDRAATRAAYSDANAKANEFLFRRVDIEDAVEAHRLAVERAAGIGFGRYIISATTPFTPEDCAALRADAPAVVARLFPGFHETYRERGWTMFPSIDRVYDNAAARAALGWRPRWDFARVLDQLRAGQAPGSELARQVGVKGYHEARFQEGPYPVE